MDGFEPVRLSRLSCGSFLRAAIQKVGFGLRRAFFSLTAFLLQVLTDPFLHLVVLAFLLAVVFAHLPDVPKEPQWIP